MHLFPRLKSIALCSVFACAAAAAFGQTSTPAKPTSILSLDPPQGHDLQVQSESSEGKALPYSPAGFRRFADANVGQESAIQQFTLRFAASARLGKITSTKDFRVEQGGSCVEGNVYEAKGTCTLLVRFTPRGAGHRLGRVAVENSASPQPFYVGLGGNSYAPVVSFTPSIMSTVAASHPSGTGLLLNAKNLAVDGGDSLYVADTGNNLVRIMDTGGQFLTIASSGIVAPVGIAVDPFGETYFSEPTQNLVYEIFEYGSVLQLSGVGTDACTVAAPCSMTSEKVYTPGMMAMDSGNQLFFEDGSRGAAVAVVQPYPATLARLYDPFTYQTTSTGVFSVDQYDNLYTVWSITGLCQINQQTYSDSANSRAVYKKVAGGKFCGFAGDGGPARNAEIGATIGQMAFDVAGNMYFTDASNQRVRRIDYSTGNISTIAGNGAAGYSGDGGAATSATLANPTGIGVDSQGQVYIISGLTSSGSSQVIRKIGTTGYLAFGSQAPGAVTAPKILTVSNTGNSVLSLTRAYIGGTNAADFTIDPNTTSCNLVAGATLANGQSCQIGILFKAGAASARSASLIMLDNTVTNTNTVTLTGSGTGTGSLLTPTFTIAAPAAGTTVAANTPVTFTVNVTSTSGTAPTGTVKFTVSGATFGSPVTVSGGKASIVVTGLTAGTRTLGATYSGDTHFTAAGPITVAVTVTAASKVPATVTLAAQSAASSAASSACTAMSFQATVSSTGSALPGGTTTLMEGNLMLGTGTLANGKTVFNVATLSAGTHILTANYAGDATHAAATSAPLKEVVTGASSCNAPGPAPVQRLWTPGSN